MTDVVLPGSAYTMYLNFYNEQSGTLDDPSAVQLDVTFGSEVSLVTDFAGPFYWTGASSFVPGQVWRVSRGIFAFTLLVPLSAPGGAYVANWSCTYGPNADVFLVTDNFVVTGGGYSAIVPSADVGYWTGSMTYSPSWASSPLAVSFGTGPDSDGIAWLWKSIQGWDSPDIAGQVIQRSADHGGWPASQFYAPRVMTLTVMASAPTQGLRDLARARLQQVIPPGDLATLLYNEPVPKQVAFRRSGRIAETYPTLADVEFTCNIVAPDPRKYSAVEKSIGVTVVASSSGVLVPFTVPFTFPAAPPPGSVVATNSGTFETRPTVVIQGPAASPAVSNVTTGQTVSFSGLVMASGDTLVLETDARQAFLNGAMRLADLDSAWWVLVPGPNTIRLGGAGSGATMTVTYRDAWI